MANQKTTPPQEHRFPIISGPNLFPILLAKKYPLDRQLLFHLENKAPLESCEHQLGEWLRVHNFSRLFYNHSDKILLFEGAVVCPALAHAIIRCRGRYNLKSKNGWLTIRWL